MTGLASGLQQSERKRGTKDGSMDPGGAWVDVVVRRLGEEQMGSSEAFPRLSFYSQLAWKRQVVKSFPQLVWRAAGCPKTSTASP